MSRDAPSAGAAVGRVGLPGRAGLVAAAKTCGGRVAVGVSSSAGSTALVAKISGEGDAKEAVGSAGGNDVATAVLSAAMTGTVGDGGPAVGVLTMPDPMGAAVAGANGSGVGANPGATARWRVPACSGTGGLPSAGRSPCAQIHR